MARKATVPRRVDFLNEPYDLRAIVLGSMGFSTFYIMEQTGLSHCQVLYRLNKAQVKRADYRNGVNATAQMIRRAVEKNVSEQMIETVAGDKPRRRRKVG